MNLARKSFFLGAICILVSISEVAKSADEPNMGKNELHVDEFGEKTGLTISNGFVFVDGVYLDSPYKVTRRGLAIFVNDRMIFAPKHKWPPRDVLVAHEPGYPNDLNVDSSFDDIHAKSKDPFDDPWHRQYRYAYQHFPPEEARLKIKEWFEGLPFVANVKAERDGFVLKVVSKKGQERRFSISIAGESYGVVYPMTKEIVLRDLEQIRSSYEKRFEKGDCYFFLSSGGELTFGSQRARDILPEIVDTLSSDADSDLKIQKLKAVGLLPPTWAEDGRKIVDGFHGSPQLTERIQQLQDKVNQGQPGEDTKLHGGVRLPLREKERKEK